MLDRVNRQQERYDQCGLILIQLHQLHLHLLHRFVLTHVQLGSYPILSLIIKFQKSLRVYMCPVYDQGLAIFKALWDVKVAAIPHHLALVDILVNNGAWLWIKLAQVLDDLLDDTCLQDVADVDALG
jgi:hypothetical protein